MKSRKEIKKEIEKVKTEITMSKMNDGWWNKYMMDKLEKLEKQLKDGDSRVFDTED